MTWYDVLGVQSTATQRELKAEFRRLAKATHPDRNPGDESAEARFKEISAAWAVLGDPDRRALYDLDLAEGKARDPFSPRNRPATTSRQATRARAGGKRVYRKTVYGNAQRAHQRWESPEREADRQREAARRAMAENRRRQEERKARKVEEEARFRADLKAKLDRQSQAARDRHRSREEETERKARAFAEEVRRRYSAPSEGEGSSS